MMMKKLAVALLALVLYFGLAGVAMAANADSHMVTVQVSAINELAIDGEDLTLTINSATAGWDPEDATDDTTCDLLWTTNEPSKKITVVTDLAFPSFTLKVEAQTIIGGGTAAGEVILNTTGTDLVTGVATTTGGCDLKYTASATAEQGTGTETHTITYTLTAS